MMLEIGKAYRVKHSRKGTFNMQITKIEGEWITGIITSDSAVRTRYDYSYQGDEITVRERFCYFAERKE
jgi:hypothetical protein